MEPITKYKNRSVAPYYEETRLAIPPRKTECIGDECPYIESIGRCGFNSHHLYFPRTRFLGGTALQAELRNDPHSIIPMAWCRHNSSHIGAVHSMYGIVLYPDDDVIAQYLDESKLLTELSVSVNNIARDINTLVSNNPAIDRSKLGKTEDSLSRHYDDFVDLTDKVHHGIEVMPGRIVTPKVVGLRAQTTSHFKKLAAA